MQTLSKYYLYVEIQDAFHLENDSVLQEKLLEKALKGLQPEDKIRAVILLSNGLDLPFSMHLIQGAAAQSRNRLAIGIQQ